MITLELEGRQPSVASLSRNVEQRKKDSSLQKQLERLSSVEKMFYELQLHTGKRKDECVHAYKLYVDSFQMWLTTILNNLQSGKLLSTDILVFEENLTVRVLNSLYARNCRPPIKFDLT